MALLLVWEKTRAEGRKNYLNNPRFRATISRCTVGMYRVGAENGEGGAGSNCR